MKNEEKILESLSMLPDDIINEAYPDEGTVRVVHRKDRSFLRIASAVAAVLLVCGVSYRYIIEPITEEMQIRSMMQIGGASVSDSEDFSESDIKILNLFDCRRYYLDNGISKVLDSFTRDDMLYILAATAKSPENEVHENSADETDFYTDSESGRKVMVYDTHGRKMEEITGFRQSRAENDFEKILPFKDNSVLYLSCYGDGDNEEENNLMVSDCEGNLHVIELFEEYGRDTVPDNFCIRAAVSDSRGMCYVLYDALCVIEKHTEYKRIYSGVLRFDISDPEGSREMIFLPGDYSPENMICVQDRIFVSAVLYTTDEYVRMNNERYRLYEADFSEGKLLKTAADLNDAFDIRFSDQGYAFYNGKVFDLINNRMTDSGEMTAAEICSLNFQKAGDEFVVIPYGTDLSGRYRYMTLIPKNS